MIALPLRVAKLYHNFNGAVIPHELLAALKQHLSSPATALDNKDEWGLVRDRKKIISGIELDEL